MRVTAWLDGLIGFCYPPRCNHCDVSLTTRRLLCEACEGELDALADASACEFCGAPSKGPCPFCLERGLRPYDRIARLGVFADPLKSLITAAKYQGKWTLAEELADRLAAKPLVRTILASADCLVATPLHPLRQLGRGYNQAGVVARVLSKRTGRLLPVAAPAVRLRHTPPQATRSSRAERLRNLRHAFGLLKPESIRGRRVVVVDDVMTTGATLRSLGNCLLAAQPASLDAIVLAVADARGRDFQAV